MRILFREAEADGPEYPWSVVAEVRNRREAEDELTSWRGPARRHGDLAIVRGSSDVTYAYDGQSGSFVRPPKVQYVSSWSDFWEGPGAESRVMNIVCYPVDARRIVSFCCDIAQEAMASARLDDGWARSAVAAARSWLSGDTSDGSMLTRANEFATPDWDLARVAIGRRAAAYAAAYAAQCAYTAAAARLGVANMERDDVIYASIACVAGAASHVRRARRVALIRRSVPLSVLVCSHAGLRDPLPMPRPAEPEAPRPRRGSRG